MADPVKKTIAANTPVKAVAKAVETKAPAAKVEAAKVEAAPKPVVPAPVVKAEAPVAPKPVAPFIKEDVPVAAAKPVAAKPEVAAIAKDVETKPAAAVAAAIEEGSTRMTDTVKQVEETVKKATAEAGEKATAMFKDMTAKAKEAFEKSGETTKEVVAFHKANFEALVESGKVAAKGAQTAAQTAADYGRKNWDATTAHVKAVAAVKSPTDALKLQSDFVRGQFDGAVAEMSKSTEFYLKLAGDVFAPIQNRYSVAADQLKTRLAA